MQDDFGFAPDQALRFTGAIMMTSMLAMIVAQLMLAKLQQPAHVMRRYGLVMAALALLLGGAASSEVMLLLTGILMGIGFGLFLPSNLALMSFSVSQHRVWRL